MACIVVKLRDSDTKDGSGKNSSKTLKPLLLETNNDSRIRHEAA